MSDLLDEFLINYIMTTNVAGSIPLHGAVRDVYGIYGVTYYRDDEYQVQMFVVPPNSIIPEHTHPNVDSFEVYLGGQIMFSHRGLWTLDKSVMEEADEKGLSKNRLSNIRVKPDDLHGGAFGPAGGVFLSVQRWLNGVEPSCVSLDYDGIALDKAHKTDFGSLEFYDRELNWHDAASKETIPPVWV
jgi:hypothetical protein